MAIKDEDLENLITDEGDDDAEKNVDRGDTLEIDDDDAGADEGEGKEPGKEPAKEKSADPDPDKEADADKERGKEGDKEAGEDDDGDDTDEPAGDKAKAPTMVPRARLNQAIEKQRDAEKRLAALEEKLRTVESVGADKKLEAYTQKLDALYEEAEKARAEGEYKEAARVQRELDTLREEAGATKAEHAAQLAAVRAQMAAAYNAVVDQAEVLEPRINPKHEDFDPDLVAEVGAVSEGFERSGKKPAEALKKALKLVLGKDISEAPSVRKKEPVEPKKTDLKKNIDAAKKTPPKSQEGAAAEKVLNVNVANLSDEEFDKLPEATKRRMRGDFVE